MANKDVNTDVNESDKIPDALWAEIEPLLPPEKPKPKASRPRMGSRKAMDARFYILGTGCQWKALPHRLGAPSAVDDRFQERPKAGVFHRIWRTGLEKSDEWKRLDWSWQSMNGAMTKAPLGGKKPGRIPRTVVRVAARAVF